MDTKADRYEGIDGLKAYIAYSCNPFAGSEDKIGWCVPYESSKTNKVYVITKEEQREPVEKYLQSHPLENIKFYYVDIPNFYKKIFKGFMYSGRQSPFIGK